MDGCLRFNTFFNSGDTYFRAAGLGFSTLLEVTEAGTIHVNASCTCTMPTKCTPVLFGFKGVKWE